jgi:hypothetical protein
MVKTTELHESLFWRINQSEFMKWWVLKGFRLIEIEYALRTNKEKFAVVGGFILLVASILGYHYGQLK